MNATANVSPPDCPEGEVCCYAKFGYETLVFHQKPSDDCALNSEGFSSAYNNSDKDIKVYDSNQGCWGDEVEIQHRSGKPMLEKKSYSFKIYHPPSSPE